MDTLIFLALSRKYFILKWAEFPTLNITNKSSSYMSEFILLNGSWRISGKYKKPSQATKIPPETLREIPA
jgi:hypothetical protein